MSDQRKHITLVGDVPWRGRLAHYLRQADFAVTARKWAADPFPAHGRPRPPDGIVVCAPLPATTLSRAITGIRAYEDLANTPIFAVFTDAAGMPERELMRCYKAGTDLAFDWTAEGATIARILADRLEAPPRKGTKASRSRDAAIRRAVKLRLEIEGADLAKQFAIKVADGQVMLTGEVPSIGELEYAEQVIGSVPGVRRIADVGVVITPMGVADREIRRTVRLLLKHYTNRDRDEVTAKVAGGIVTLHGAVASHHEIRRIHELVAHVRGVVQIDDHMVVSTTLRSKLATIRRRIEQAICLCHPGLDVRVRVYPGTVILEGIIPLLSVKRELISIATRENQVDHVRSKLLVMPERP